MVGNEKPWYRGQAPALAGTVIEFGLRMNLKRFILGLVSLINYLKCEPNKLKRQLHSLKNRCEVRFKHAEIRY